VSTSSTFFNSDPPANLVLGIDPGSQHTGYGLIMAQGQKLALVAQGRISPPAAWPLPRRLAHIHRDLAELMAGHKPQTVAVEDIFYGKNVRSALKLGHVRGVVLLAAAQAGLEVFEYAPRQVKNSVAGYGQAEKNQVAHMVAELLDFHQPLAPDAADALAVAICHAGQCRLMPGLRGSGGRGGSWRNMSEGDLAALNYGKGGEAIKPVPGRTISIEPPCGGAWPHSGRGKS